MLIKKLKSKQGNISDLEFARTLGISRQLWQMIRTGERGIGVALLSGTVRAYPDLIPDVFLFLSGNAQIATLDVGITPKPHQMHQNGFLSRLKRKLRELVKRR